MDTKILMPDEILINEGDLSDKCVYLLISGELDVSIKGKSINRIQSEEVFGEMAYWLDGPRSATVKAVSKSMVIKFSASNLHKQLDSLDPWVQALIRGLMRKVFNLTKQIGDK